MKFSTLKNGETAVFSRVADIFLRARARAKRAEQLASVRKPSLKSVAQDFPLTPQRDRAGERR